jgi:hypothetical protein
MTKVNPHLLLEVAQKARDGSATANQRITKTYNLRADVVLAIDHICDRLDISKSELLDDLLRDKLFGDDPSLIADGRTVMFTPPRPVLDALRQISADRGVLIGEAAAQLLTNCLAEQLQLAEAQA